jgi:hypothetical protein
MPVVDGRHEIGLRFVAPTSAVARRWGPEDQPKAARVLVRPPTPSQHYHNPAPGLEGRNNVLHRLVILIEVLGLFRRHPVPHRAVRYASTSRFDSAVSQYRNVAATQ